jgi:hypothetical protein
VDITSYSDLANPAHLRAFVDATSDMMGASALAVLGAMAVALERQLRRRSDDMDEVRRVGRVLQAVRVETESTGPRTGARGGDTRRPDRHVTRG